MFQKRKRAVHRVYGSTVVIVKVIFYDLVVLLMFLYGVTPFKQAHTVYTKRSNS